MYSSAHEFGGTGAGLDTTEEEFQWHENHEQSSQESENDLTHDQKDKQ